jgi:ribosomal protein S18 acetylase RimI-like enzyme
MDVTLADSDDIDRIVDLWIALAEGQRSYGSHLRSEANRTKIRETIARRIVSDRLLVARDGEIQGFVMFRTEAERYVQDHSRGIVENLYVAEGNRGQGIGSALLAAAEEQLQDSGAVSIALEVMVDNERARAFYRDQGYDQHRVELEKDLENP